MLKFTEVIEPICSLLYSLLSIEEICTKLILNHNTKKWLLNKKNWQHIKILTLEHYVPTKILKNFNKLDYVFLNGLYDNYFSGCTIKKLNIGININSIQFIKKLNSVNIDPIELLIYTCGISFDLNTIKISNFTNLKKLRLNGVYSTTYLTSISLEELELEQCSINISDCPKLTKIDCIESDYSIANCSILNTVIADDHTPFEIYNKYSTTGPISKCPNIRNLTITFNVSHSLYSCIINDIYHWKPSYTVSEFFAVEHLELIIDPRPCLEIDDRDTLFKFINQQILIMTKLKTINIKYSTECDITNILDGISPYVIIQLKN